MYCVYILCVTLGSLDLIHAQYRYISIIWKMQFLFDFLTSIFGLSVLLLGTPIKFLNQGEEKVT